MKALRALLCLVLLAFAVAAAAEGIPYDAVLTAGAWSSDIGSELTFNADGTGRLVSTGVDTETAWSLDGMTVTIEYEFYGVRSVVYTLSANDANWTLASESNPEAYIGPALQGTSSAATEEPEPVEEPEPADEPAPAEEPEPAEEPVEAPAEPEVHERTPYGTTILLGDGIYLETVEMTWDEIGTTKQIVSNVTGEGEYETREPEEGNTYFYVTGDITNLLGYEVDIRNIYGEFFFDDGKDVYKADFAPSVEGAEKFAYEVLPATEIGTIGHYAFCTVPDELVDGYTSCVLKLGYTNEFDYKMAVNGGYQYERLDDVFYVILKEDPLKEYSDRAIIRAVQEALNDQGYDCGTPDGVAGKKTGSAISAYQAANGLNATGTANFETITSLGIVPAMSY